jgi:hypothetical protein
MLAARFAALGLAVGLAALPARAVAPRTLIVAPWTVGSPLLCFPLDVGGAATLPFGGDGFDIKSDLTTEEVVKLTRTLLEKSDDPLVHMETLRRATIWFMSKDEAAAAKFRAQLAEGTLLAAAATGDGAARTRGEALCWFDLGYFQAAARQGGVLQLKNEHEWLEKAARLAPDDLALRFGVALAQYFPGAEEDRKAWATHLQVVLDAKEPSPLVKKNAVTTFGAFLHASDWEKLGAEVRKKLGRA